MAAGLIGFLGLCAAPDARCATPAPTVTLLQVTTTAGTASSVASGTVVTLTAKVTAGGAIVNPGQVQFCDAAATYCEDIHLLATAQLTKQGTAVFKFRPGIGSHSYRAQFRGTTAAAASASSASSLTVTGHYNTVTSITQGGSAGSYSLTATVAGVINKPDIATPTGEISFLNTSNANSVIASAPLGAGTAGLSFSPVSTPVAGFVGSAITSADFNGDGIADLAVASIETSDSPEVLNILLGNADGTFRQVSTVTISSEYSGSVISGDFNADGVPDLAVTNNGGTEVAILLGQGDGTFKAAANLNTAGSSTGIALGDFNHDGNADLAILAGSEVETFLGNGDGTFQVSSKTVTLTGSPTWVSVADFNGDGNDDLAVTNDSTVSVFLGDGLGGFTAKGTPTSINTAQGLSSGDFNGDGIPDLVAISYEANENNVVVIMIGKGDGTFAAPVYYDSQGLFESLQVVVADLNGDGVADLVVATKAAADAVLLGNGDGTFRPAADVTAGGFGFIAVADFNGDGIPDLATGWYNAGLVGPILLAQPNQTVTATVANINPAGAGAQNVIASYAGDSLFNGSTSSAVALTPGVSTPIISPASGTYTTQLKVTITDTTPGTTIYYEAGNTVRTTGWVVYTGPISLPYGGYEIINAYATKTGLQQSGYASAEYTLNLPAAPAPLFSVQAGNYKTAQTVTLTDSVAGASIFYTTNGTQPTLTSNPYTGPITVSTSETLVAAAIAPGYSISAANSAQYFIDSSSAALIYRVAGNGMTGWSGDGSLATGAQINAPIQTAFDAAGNMYFADDGSNLIRKVAAATGIITTVAGNGRIGYSGDKGPATAAELYSPNGVAVDSAGNIYIADTVNNVIRMVTASTGIITTVAGTGTGGYSGDNGPATSATMSSPYGIAIDPSGNLLIADYGTNRIRKVTVKTGIITTVAGNGYSNFFGDNGPATNASLASPQGVAVDQAGNIYIADTYNSSIRKVAAATGIITTLAGSTEGVYGYSGDGGAAANALLNDPTSVAVDASGNVYVNDFYNYVIRKITASNGIISTVAGNGYDCSSVSGDGSPAASVGLCGPSAVSVDASGNMYISEITGAHIRKVISGAVPSAAAAAPVFSLQSGTYAQPQSVTVADATPGASIYVTFGSTNANTLSYGANGPIAVTGSLVVHAIALAPGYLTSSESTATYTITSPPPAIVSSVAGNGKNVAPAAGAQASSASIGQPIGVAMDKAGNLYFSDINFSTVWKITASTGVISAYAGNPALGGGYSGDGGPATSAQLSYPTGLAFDSAGNLYIADAYNYVVRKVSATTGFISTVAGVYQHYSTIGDGGPATSANLFQPLGVAVDSADNLYISDTLHSAVRKVSASTGIISTVAGMSGLTPVPDAGDGGPATSASVNNPGQLAFDSAGNLYIPEYFGAGRVRKVTAKTGIISTVAGNGIGYKSSGDGGLATDASLSPGGVTVDSANNLYITDGTASVVRKVDASTGIISRIAGNGYGGYFGDGGSATIAELAGPYGLTLDPSGNLYVADEFNGRIRKVTFASSSASTLVVTPGSLAFPSTTVGSTSAAQLITIKNTGTSAVTFGTFTFTGTNASSFTRAASPCGSALSAGASCTLTFYFKPVATGALTATFNIVDNATGSPQTVTLSGTAISAAPMLTVTPGSLAFPSTKVGVMSAGQTITLKNTGTSAVTFGTFTFTGTNASSFTRAASPCGSALAAGASCTLTFYFKPVSTGALTATFNIADNATGSPQTVALSGTAISAAPTLTVTPGSLAFPSTKVGVMSAGQTITLKNTGASAVTFGIFTFTGTNASSFTRAASPCGSALAAGASCTLTFYFKPVSTGALTATFNIADNATGSPQTVALSGTGTSAAPTLTVTPGSLAFPSTKVGVMSAGQTITLKNTGTSAVTFGIFTFTGTNASSFTRAASPCGSALSAGASCILTFYFKPVSTGALTATFNVVDNATGSPQTVALSGIGD